MLWLLLLTIFNCGTSLAMNLAPSSESKFMFIKGGHDAMPGKWPWQVSLWRYNRTLLYWEFKCGGSLIHRQWVLTTAHCVELNNEDFQVFRVQVGQVRLLDVIILQKLAEIISHPNYNTTMGAESVGDLALLKLEKPVTLSDHVRPVTLPSARLRIPAGTKCWATGWGLTEGDEVLPEPYNLQEVEIPIVDDEVCKEQYGKIDVVITEDMLCAGAPGKGIRPGDSGGPLVCHWKDTWLQIGVASWGEDITELELPAVFVRVTYYRQWIRRYVRLGRSKDASDTSRHSRMLGEPMCLSNPCSETFPSPTPPQTLSFPPQLKVTEGKVPMPHGL